MPKKYNLCNKVFKLKQEYVDDGQHIHFYSIPLGYEVSFNVKHTVLVLDGKDPYNVTLLYNNNKCICFFPDGDHGPHFLTFFEEFKC